MRILLLLSCIISHSHPQTPSRLERSHALRIIPFITTSVAALAILAALACGAESPTPAPTATGTSAPPTVPSAPVSRSDVETTFNEPLASGLSIADVTENALPSVAHIVTGTGSGTGFIVNESGLVVTNKHVVDWGGFRLQERIVRQTPRSLSEKQYSNVSVRMASGTNRVPSALKSASVRLESSTVAASSIPPWTWLTSA